MDVHERLIAMLYQSLDSQGQAVPGDGLGDVFHELAAIGRSVDPVGADLCTVMDGRAAELVIRDIGLRVEQSPAAWQGCGQVIRDLDQIAFAAEDDAVRESDRLGVLHD